MPQVHGRFKLRIDNKEYRKNPTPNGLAAIGQLPAFEGRFSDPGCQDNMMWALISVPMIPFALICRQFLHPGPEYALEKPSFLSGTIPQLNDTDGRPSFLRFYRNDTNLPVSIDYLMDQCEGSPTVQRQKVLAMVQRPIIMAAGMNYWLSQLGWTITTTTSSLNHFGAIEHEV